MAFISRKCIECTDPTRKVSGSYKGKDRQGTFRGDMYTCENKICEIYRARDREARRLTTAQTPEKPNESGKSRRASR